MSKIIELFFPRDCKCIFCGRETKRFGICDDCYNKLPFITGKTCSLCGARNPSRSAVCIECKGRGFAFKQNYAVLDYAGEVQSKIVSFKQEGNKYIGRAFAWLILDKFKELNLNVDLIVPIPISPERLKERGFNQTDVLCSMLDQTLVKTDVIIRAKNTPHQTGLSRENRENNLKFAFEVVDKDAVKDKRVLLVDDIYTTGSTLNECASTLIQQGAKDVYALTLARSPIKNHFENKR